MFTRLTNGGREREERVGSKTHRVVWEGVCEAKQLGDGRGPKVDSYSRVGS